MNCIQTAKIFIIITLLAGKLSLYSQQTGALYYFAVGSSHYTKTNDSSADNFSNLEHSKYSAEIFKKSCLNLGAKKGVILSSSEKEPISSVKIFSSLKSFISKIKKDKTKNKLLLLYFCGHGIAEKETKTVLFLPGNINSVITSSDIGTYIKKLEPSINFLIFFDCCYDLSLVNPGLRQVDSSEAYARRINRQVVTKNFYVRLTIIGREEDLMKKNPAIFAAKPGESAKFLPSPINSDSASKIGPLSRRLYLITQEWKKKPLKFVDFFRQFMDPSFDPLTISMSTNFEHGCDCPWQKLLNFEKK